MAVLTLCTWPAGFQTHTTPVLLGAGERAELGTEKYIALTPMLEGIVILKCEHETSGYATGMKVSLYQLNTAAGCVKGTCWVLVKSYANGSSLMLQAKSRLCGSNGVRDGDTTAGWMCAMQGVAKPQVVAAVVHAAMWYTLQCYYLASPHVTPGLQAQDTTECARSCYCRLMRRTLQSGVAPSI